MFQKKPSSRFFLFTLTSLLFLLLILLSCTISTTTSSSSEDPPSETDPTIEDELQELIAIDEQEGEEEEVEERGGDGKERQHFQEQKEAEVLSKAQRIVLELNSDNVKRVIDGNEYVLVLGYAPWCGRSAELMPQFAEAANTLKELGSGLLMAKIDAERYPKAASSLGIKGFPTLLLFVNGSSQVYTGGFSGEDMVIWARKKTGFPVIRMVAAVEAEEFLSKYQTFVLGLFDKFEGTGYEEFLKAAASDNEIQFAEVNDMEVAKVLFPEVKDTNTFIGLVKSEPERYASYEGAYEMVKILEFVNHNKYPLLTRLTDLNSARVYDSPIKLQVMVFVDADDLKNLVNPLQEVAKKFKSKIMFIYVDIDDENLAKPFLTLFGLENSEDPIVTAFDNRNSSKYLLELDPTPSNIDAFCSGLLHGSLSPYFKSQAIPDNREASVQVIVGKTFDDLVLNTPKNVLLEVYTPWCINCKTTSKQIEKLAKHFKDLESLVIGKIDASANEHPKLQVNEYPTLLLYPAGDKANPIKLSTKSSSKDLAANIKSHLKAEEQTVKDEL